MNNEIKQMCEQAKVYANESTKDFTGDEPVVWMDYYTEKFAELIVKECVIQCEREWIRHGTDSIHNQAIHGCINSIKQHFGVEE